MAAYRMEESEAEAVVKKESELTLKDKRKFVKKFLLEQGFFVNDGIKYGLDFLVYTAHPDLVHSKYGLIVHSEMTFQNLILYQRVCNSNNKTLVIAFVNKIEDRTNIKLVKCQRFITKNKKES
jgi:tRNA splicing endonuclease